MKRTILFFVLFIFACVSGKSQAADNEEDVIWRKEVSTPQEVKFSPDDKHLASLNRSKTNLLYLKQKAPILFLTKQKKKFLILRF